MKRKRSPASQTHPGGRAQGRRRELPEVRGYAEARGDVARARQNTGGRAVFDRDVAPARQNTGGRAVFDDDVAPARQDAGGRAVFDDDVAPARQNTGGRAVFDGDVARGWADNLLWLVSTALLGLGLHRVAAGYGNDVGRASFTGHPISDAWAIAIVGGLALALTVLGIKRGGGQ